MGSQEATPLVRVWDRVVRLTHWSVAALVLWDWWEDSGGSLHRWLGYLAAALVLVRLAWGFVGSEPARFRTWLPSCARLLGYARALRTGRPPRHLSHNPLGALMMLLMWTLVLALALTGWISRLDAFWGEEWPISTHAVLADALVALALLHVCAALVMGRLHRENLVTSMLTGRKRPAGK